MPPSRATYLRRRVTVFGLIGTLLAGGVYLPMTLLAPLEPLVAEAAAVTEPENPPAELDWPGYGASAIGAVDFPGTLAASGDSTPRSIASITKVITSLVVLQAKPLALGEAGENITFTRADTALYHKYFAQNGKVEPVRSGLVFSQLQLMQVVLVSSANNYAESLATWAFGSEPAFLDAARTWLDAHGLTDTTLLDSTGMNPGNTSTTANLVELGKLALADPVIADIVSTPTVTLPYVGTIENTNGLLGHGGVDGIKTGTLPQAGSCLLFATDIPVGEKTVTVVGVVLGADDHASLNIAVQRLLATVSAGFREVELVHAGEVFATYSTPWGQDARAIAAASESVLLWAGTPVTAAVRVDDVRAGAAGEEVGAVTYTVGDRQVVVPLALDAPLGDPGPWWRLTNPLEVIG